MYNPQIQSQSYGQGFNVPMMQNCSNSVANDYVLFQGQGHSHQSSQQMPQSNQRTQVSDFTTGNIGNHMK